MQEKVRVFLKGDEERVYPKGVTVMDVARDISPKLAKEALIARVNGVLVDLNYKLEEDSKVEILTFEDEEGRNAFRHSTSHVMAQAVKRLFPDVKLGIGPSIEDGFYYDFDRDESFTPEDLEKIEKEMEKIVAEDHPFVRIEVTREEAIKKLQEMGEPYKIELVENLPDDAKISFYQNGE
ncbi:MAG TPA: TGS domain-containing protein, partial [Tissierellaceae bacterium]